MNHVEKSLVSANGTKIKITIETDGAINETTFPILRDEVLLNTAECAISFIDALKPKANEADGGRG